MAKVPYKHTCTSCGHGDTIQLNAGQVLGMVRSPNKAKAARKNGSKGGRPIDPNSKRQQKLKGK